MHSVGIAGGRGVQRQLNIFNPPPVAFVWGSDVTPLNFLVNTWVFLKLKMHSDPFCAAGELTTLSQTP